MRKRWVVKISKDEKSSFQYDWTKKYKTEKSAKQALSDWESGKGNLGFICKPEEGWKGEVFYN